MASIPPHYTDRFILQRYNKALHFVQHLPATSNFQPTKSQKLELYALYKQVSEGDINTQRPGLFDVVGRAKWDAWKKLEGTTALEARHIYVEALLRVATEAYKKNTGREEAQRIIHAFAIMKPSGADDSSDDLLDTDDTSTNQEDDTSDASEEAEEKAYLREIQESTSNITPFNIATDSPANNHSNTTSPYGSPDCTNVQSRRTPTLTRSILEQHHHQQQQQQVRPSSAASIQTMVTAPGTPRQLPTYANRPPSVTNSFSSGVRPRSAVSSRLGQYSSTRGSEKKPAYMTEFIDVNVNPWQQISTNRPNLQQQQQDSGASSSGKDSDTETRGIGSRSRTPIANERYIRKASSYSSSHPRLPSPMYQQKQQHRKGHLSSPSPPLYSTQQQQIHAMTPIHNSSSAHFQSPVPGSSASSSVTATPQNNMLGSMSEGRTTHRHFAFASSEAHLQQQQQQQHQQMTMLALGPATKRALESLQNEVIALNDRIDDLRRELVERDKQKRVKSSNDRDSDDDNDSLYDMGDGWLWVIKAAVKYAGPYCVCNLKTN
ncbi:hypothetical protein [Parasitella parasitica]|uniref:ACB domain-containing protein n=1 Tax=Parasitella parasitica TaxID=35722 RepID=A0A0B7NBZ7_9FUNG|nr:hypothetical protein [Parasitella parasitica]